jgi:hypothetical protein
MNPARLYPIDYTAFRLSESDFENHSHRHGINHTYRVMYHVLNIGTKAGLSDAVLPAWCAAFIHDMARQHDGYCTQHGYWASRDKLPRFAALFKSQGITDQQMEAISLAISMHSENSELPVSHIHYPTVALLKDADALDRIRISESNLKPKYLRFDESKNLIDFAKQLFYRTNDRLLGSFDELLEIVEDENITGF